jgi:transposase
MSQKPITMNHVKQIIQLKQDGVAIKEIVRRVGICRNSVRKYLGLVDADAKDLSSKELADKVYNNDALEFNTNRRQQLFLFFEYASTELSKTGVTRQLLWHEYLQKHPDGYGYSQFCYHLKQHQKQGDLAMHLEYTSGDVSMVDYAGKPLYYTDELTGEQIACQIFISVLPFSGLIYCEAAHTQQTADFIHCINGMLSFYGGAPSTILCDNLKTAVIRPSRYEPVFTEVCNQLGEHYGTTFSATRPYSPRDKAMVELAVRIVYTAVYAPLRNRVFTSLQSLNTAIRKQIILLNHKPYKNTAYSRWYFYEQQERSLLRSLPTEIFSPKKVVVLTVQRNYHVQLSETRHYYSVPYTYVGKKVRVLYDNRVVEIYYEHERIAIHFKKIHQKAYTTLGEHMPPHHQHMQQIKGFNKEDLLKMAARIGNSTAQAAALMLDNSIYMEQNYKSCFGTIMLQKKYGPQRLEAACARALMGTRINYTMIKNILERGMDKQLPLIVEPSAVIPTHDNIRGKDHYQ